MIEMKNGISFAKAKEIPFQLVKKFAAGDFFDDFCTVCLFAFGSPGGKRR